MPLFVVSVAFFLYAAYRFISPHFLTPAEKLTIARELLKADRPDAAIDQVNSLFSSGKLHGETEGEAHLLIAEALEDAQTQQHVAQPQNYGNIIHQTQLALNLGVKPTADIYRRVAQSYEALGDPADALGNYRLAMQLDKNLDLKFGKKIIELQIAAHDPGAEQSIDAYLDHPQLSPSEKAWALDEKAQLLIASGKLDQAKGIITQGLSLKAPPELLGPLNYRMGLVEWKQNNGMQAERNLRVARDQLGVQEPLDAEAAYLLGKIMQARQDYRQGIAFYQAVLTSHPESSRAPLCLLGRAGCRLALGDEDAGLADLHDLTEELAPQGKKFHDEPAVISGLESASVLLAEKANYAGALEILNDEQQLMGQPPAEFFARLGDLFEKRADQLENNPVDASIENGHAKQLAEIRDLRSKAGDAYITYSRALTVKDDAGYGDALWKGIDLYDRAGDTQRTISALELFVAQRPDDPLTPEALLRLGRSYQAAGEFDKAIATFEQNQFRFPNTLAASKSAIPLAQVYIAKGPEFFERAVRVLRAVLENNGVLTPKAEEFKQALFELGQLYYRTDHFEEAVGRLQEWTARYPNDPRLGQVLFLMADSYRKSALLLDAQLASNPKPTTAPSTQPSPDATEVAAARRVRLTKARQFYDQLIDWYRDKAPANEIDKLQLKLAHFYRADCVYDLGDYPEAVKLYDEAAFRYQNDPSALAAYVQIVNSYCAMGKMQEAKTANERAKWLLRRMPASAFSGNASLMPRKYWEQWLAWTSNSGMWK